MEKKHTKEEIMAKLNLTGPILEPAPYYYERVKQAMEEYALQQREEPWHDLYLEEHMKKLLAEQQLKARDEEVEKLVNALSHLVNANQNEASWDYPAAFSNAMEALKPYSPPKD